MLMGYVSKNHNPTEEHKTAEGHQCVFNTVKKKQANKTGFSLQIKQNVY